VARKKKLMKYNGKYLRGTLMNHEHT